MTQHVPERADELSALRRLYPELSDKEIEEAQEALDRYVDLVARMAERIKADPEAYEQFRRLLEDRMKPKE